MDNLPVYFMNTYDIENIAEFRQYGAKVSALLPRYGAEVLASDTTPIVLEGNARMMNAIIRFPSEEAALKCYRSAEYQEIRKIRIRSTRNCTMVLVKHWIGEKIPQSEISSLPS